MGKDDGERVLCTESWDGLCLSQQSDKNRYENLMGNYQDCLGKLLQSLITNLKRAPAKLIFESL